MDDVYRFVSYLFNSSKLNYLITYVHSSQQGHLSTEPYCQSSMEFGYKVDSIVHIELHKCSPHTDKYASLLFG